MCRQTATAGQSSNFRSGIPTLGYCTDAMLQENAETVRRLFTAFDRQDWQAALDLFDPAVEWSPTEGTYHGPEGVVSSLAEWLEPWEEHHVEVEEVIDAGDQVLAVVHLTGRGAHSGMEIDQRFFQVYAVRSGRIIRMVEFVTRDEALAAAGVKDQESRTDSDEMR